MHSPPWEVTRAGTERPSSSRTSPMTTRAPSRVKRWASAAPMPRAPPLMSATLPARRIGAGSRPPCARAAQELAGHRAGVLPVAQEPLPIDHGGGDPARTLHEPAGAGRQVVGD